MVWGDSCFRRNGMGGFLLSQEWYGEIPAFAGMDVKFSQKINVFCH